MKKLSRDELIELADRIRDPGTYSEDEIDGFIAVFNANVPMPEGAMLIFWPPEEEMKSYEGRMREWDPSSEEVVDRAMAYELKITPMPSRFPSPDEKQEP